MLLDGTWANQKNLNRQLFSFILGSSYHTDDGFLVSFLLIPYLIKSRDWLVIGQPSIPAWPGPWEEVERCRPSLDTVYGVNAPKTHWGPIWDPIILNTFGGGLGLCGWFSSGNANVCWATLKDLADVLPSPLSLCTVLFLFYFIHH